MESKGEQLAELCYRLAIGSRNGNFQHWRGIKTVIVESAVDIVKFYNEHDGNLSSLKVAGIGQSTKKVIKTVLERELLNLEFKKTLAVVEELVVRRYRLPAHQRGSTGDDYPSPSWENAVRVLEE